MKPGLFAVASILAHQGGGLKLLLTKDAYTKADLVQAAKGCGIAFKSNIAKGELDALCKDAGCCKGKLDEIVNAKQGGKSTTGSGGAPAADGTSAAPATPADLTESGGKTLQQWAEGEKVDMVDWRAMLRFLMQKEIWYSVFSM